MVIDCIWLYCIKTQHSQVDKTVTNIMVVFFQHSDVRCIADAHEIHLNRFVWGLEIETSTIRSNQVSLPSQIAPPTTIIKTILPTSRAGAIVLTAAGATAHVSHQSHAMLAIY